MPEFTVLIPTHDHVSTLRYSIASVQAQTVQDFEIFVVGDGAPLETRTLVHDLAARDSRIWYFENEKGERHGELHRHVALAEARGRYIAYLPDDDLWAPEHLERVCEALQDHDLVHTMHIGIRPDGRLSSRFFDARVEADLAQMRRSSNGFGLGVGAHSMGAYRRLPRGWNPAPPSMATDIFFWLQFLEQSWCRYRPLFWPTLFHFSSRWRRGHDAKSRETELARWARNLSSGDFRSLVVRRALEAILVAEHRAAVASLASEIGRNHESTAAISLPPGD